MQANLIMDRLKAFDWKKHELRLKQYVQQKPILVGIGVIGILLIFNVVGLSSKSESKFVEKSTTLSFQNGRILNDRESTFYYGREKLLSQKTQAMFDGQSKLEARLAELEKKLQESKTTTATQTSDLAPKLPPSNLGIAPQDPSTFAAPPGESAIQVYPPQGDAEDSRVATKPRGVLRSRSKGPDLIAFPVKAETKTDSVMLPSGSYVKAKVLTGVDVPEGKTYPVLMVLDFSYVAPNDHKIDLSGCFMIAKAEGDLSTERVQMQATKMSCVSKKGKMFERDVNGFVADDKDGSFAMKGQVNSKQGRVAAMAFIAGVVEGVGKAVQASQTTQSTNALGGSSSVLTGDVGKAAVAGGASNAAGMVAQWYLQQAQSLAPTVSISSGRDIWIVMKDKVSLPEEFFRKEKANGEQGIYSYFSRVLE